MLNLLKKNLFLVVIVVAGLIFFQKTIISALLPIPADTIVGLYYPFRDNYVSTNPNGLPYKNFLITDPVRQIYPWRNLVFDSLKKIELPLWNQYNFSGTPLLANFQSAAFYPLNILFFILPFPIGWSVLIILQPILAGLFMYLYLSNLKLRREASFFGSIVFSFCGFFVAWLEWGNIVNTALWLPLILLSIDKFVSSIQYGVLSRKNIWSLIFLLSIVFSFFAGHLQTFFYMYIISTLYFIFRLFDQKNKLKLIALYFILNTLFLILTAVQWVPTLQFILLSARDADLSYRTSGWFIPWQNLIQFIAPDFFGNTSTLNYFGEWNYGEFVGYIGIIPLIFAFFAIIFKRTKETVFFAATFLLVILFAFPNPIAKFPFVLNIPFISTAQPTRLIFLADFALSILAAIGFEEYFKRGKKILYVFPLFILIFLLLWSFVIGGGFGFESAENLLISKQNLKLPTILFFASIILLTVPLFTFVQKNKKTVYVLMTLIVLISLFDLFRFAWKFESFSPQKYLFPDTRVLSFIKKQPGIFRVMSTDSQILPPNFSIMYGISSPEGYDPLYIKRYGELMAAYGRNKPDISAPFGFNRTITPRELNSKIVDLLNIKYVLSFAPVIDGPYSKVYSDGKVNVFQNENVLPRAFFVPRVKFVNTKQEAIDEMFKISYSPDVLAVVEGKKPADFKSAKDVGKIKINLYSSNKISLSTESGGEGFLILTDAYYPTWHAMIDGHEVEIFITDFAFRGIIVPEGNHNIEFINKLL